MGKFRYFTSPNGFQVIAGRNANENDELTCKLAAPQDLWFHAKDSPGSHVIMKYNVKYDVKDVPIEDIIYASEIALKYSKSVNKKIDYCLVQDVLKPKGAPPGLVNLLKFKTLNLHKNNLKQ